MEPRPDIQQLLRRHIEGTEAEKRAIDEAMAGVKVTSELAREAAIRGLEHARAGRMKEARREHAEAQKWMRLHAAYKARLISSVDIDTAT